jgi:hypothetical protein
MQWLFLLLWEYQWALTSTPCLWLSGWWHSSNLSCCCAWHWLQQVVQGRCAQGVSSCSCHRNRRQGWSSCCIPKFIFIITIQCWIQNWIRCQRDIFLTNYMKYPPYYVSQSQFCKRDDQNGVIETVANSFHSLKKPIISKTKRKRTCCFWRVEG